MGQSTSSSSQSGEQPQLPPVKNLDQFLDRLRQLLRAECLTRQEEDWFRSLFVKFSSGSDTTPTWDESDLIEFLGITLPDDIKPTLRTAGPLIHRCMIRLGSFPYQNQPVSSLTPDVALVAVIILLRRHKKWARAISDAATGEDDEEEKWSEWQRRLFFQCMAIRDSPEEDSNQRETASNVGRNDVDDKDLLRAYRFVSDHNKRRDWERHPKIVHHGPPMISASELPSSQSQDFSGFIPRNELESLVKLLIANQLYLIGNGPEILVQEGEQLDVCVESIMNSFPRSDEAPGIGWESFNRVFSELPNIFSGINRLLAPFITPHDREQIDSAARADISVLLQNIYSSPSQPSKLPEGSIFSLPILAEIATFLPEGRLAFQDASLLYTTKGAKLELATLKREMDQRSQPLLLLVSGVASGKGDSNERTSICIGAFLPDKDQEKRHIEQGILPMLSNVFQLRPSHNVSSGPEATVTGEESSNILEVKIAERDYATARLVLDEQAQTAIIHHRKHDENGDTPTSEIEVKAVDLVGFPSDKGLLDSLVDRKFFIDSEPKLKGK